jgi:hypothetical protein
MGSKAQVNQNNTLSTKGGDDSQAVDHPGEQPANAKHHAIRNQIYRN